MCVNVCVFVPVCVSVFCCMCVSSFRFRARLFFMRSTFFLAVAPDKVLFLYHPPPRPIPLCPSLPLLTGLSLLSLQRCQTVTLCLAAGNTLWLR